MTPRGIRNNNPGNIRYVEGVTSTYQGCTGSDGAFCTFDTPVNGIRALGKLLLSYQQRHGIRTIREAINRWAPPSENDTGAYVAAVAAAVGYGPDMLLDFADPGVLRSLATAIIRHENNQQPYDAGTIAAGIGAALGIQSEDVATPAAQNGAGDALPPPTPPPSPAPADAPSGPPVQPQRPYNPEQEAPTMAPILLAPILQLIPQLISAFGKGDRATKNAAAATAVVDAFTRAVPEAVNTQDAIERATADPTVLQQARAAVLNDPVVLALQEVGGGIGAARQRDDAAMAAGAWYRPLLTPAFLISLLLLGFVGFVLIQVVGDAGGLWRPEDRSQVLMLAVAIVSAVMGYYLGSSLGSARKDDLLTRNSTQ